MKNKKFFNITVILISIIYLGLIVVTNVSVQHASLAYEKGSYAEKFASENNLKAYEISDSERKYLDVRYEEFDYNIENDKVILVGYPGISEELVIPEMINGRIVTSIDKGFFESANTVKSIYLPDTFESINDDINPDITIYCTDNSVFYNLEMAKKAIRDKKNIGWKIITIPDSQFVNFSLDRLDFTYNESADSIEITDYDGNGSLVVIPSYICGKPVTKISMNLLDQDIVFIPKTVTLITGEFNKTKYSMVFVVEFVFTIIAIMVVLIIMNGILLKKHTVQEYSLNIPRIVISYIYLIFQIVFSFFCIYGGNENGASGFLISLLVLVIYIGYMSAASANKNQIKNVDKNRFDKTARMREIKEYGKIDAFEVSNEDIRRKLERFVEELQYSDISSVNQAAELEDCLMDTITQLKSAIKDNNNEPISALCDKALKILKQRNEIVKRNK